MPCTHNPATCRSEACNDDSQRGLGCRYTIGWREDWRFSEYRRSMGWAWYPASFFVAYVSQHLMLVGTTTPCEALTTLHSYSSYMESTTFPARTCHR